MNLTNKFQTDRIINIEKSEYELIESLKKVNHNKLDVRNGVITIHGKTFYNFICQINTPEVKIIAKLKNNILIIILIFLIFWTIGFTNQYGIFIGLPTTILGVVFFGFVHKRLMELSLDEITEIIKTRT